MHMLAARLTMLLSLRIAQVCERTGDAGQAASHWCGSESHSLRLLMLAWQHRGSGVSDAGAHGTGCRCSQPRCRASTR